MKITVEFSENEIKGIMKYSGEKKKGPAIRKFVLTELLLKRRRELNQKFFTGEWSADLPEIETIRKSRDLKWPR